MFEVDKTSNYIYIQGKKPYGFLNMFRQSNLDIVRQQTFIAFTQRLLHFDPFPKGHMSLNCGLTICFRKGLIL